MIYLPLWISIRRCLERISGNSSHCFLVVMQRDATCRANVQMRWVFKPGKISLLPSSPSPSSLRDLPRVFELPVSRVPAVTVSFSASTFLTSHLRNNTNTSEHVLKTVCLSLLELLSTPGINSSNINMCFYSYDVYGRCGHCEIGLVSFCEDAVPIGDDTATQEQKEPATSRGDDDDDNNDPDQPGPPRHASQASHSTQHQPSTGQDTAKSSPSGSSNTSFHTATSTPQHSTEHEQPSGQMDAVRQWMTSGSSTATTSQGTGEFHKVCKHSQPFLIRQPG